MYVYVYVYVCMCVCMYVGMNNVCILGATHAHTATTQPSSAKASENVATRLMIVCCR